MNTDLHANPAPVVPQRAAPPLDLDALLAGARILVMGGTGFLGTVWFSMLLHRFP
ncbi:MAG: hypothetical protein RL071_917, partial [Pseudomonadota bacterium]